MHVVVAAVVLVVLVSSSACFERTPDEVVVDRAVAAAGVVVHETIVRQATLHDPVFERRYTIAWGGDVLDLGGYADEAAIGMDEPPRVSGDAVVVLSGAHVALVRPRSGTAAHARVTWFDAYDAACFGARGDGLNGHYDLVALDAAVDGERLTFTYGRRADALGAGAGPTFVFVSRDGGRTFTCE